MEFFLRERLLRVQPWPTMKSWNSLQLYRKFVNGRVPLIAGVGTNDTRDSIEFVKEVAEFGGFAAGLAMFLLQQTFSRRNVSAL